MKKNITVTDIEEIKFQADMIAGLSSVFTDYLSFTEEDELLTDALRCLMYETYRMRDNCESLLEKYCNDPNVQY